MSNICWICEKNPADSREHRIKKTDFVSVMGTPKQNNPRFLHSQKTKNIPVTGAEADILKYDKNICKDCNNRLTQPHDQSWQHLSHELRSKYLLNDSSIRLTKIFPYNARRHKKNVHLYFLKTFGCFIQSGIGIDGLEKKDVDKILQALSAAIMRDKWHQNFFLMFGKTPFKHLEDQVGFSNLDSWRYKDSGEIAATRGFYHVGSLSVMMLYDGCGDFHDPQQVNHARYGFKFLRMSKLADDGRDRITR
jgi:hypothetical protein